MFMQPMSSATVKKSAYGRKMRSNNLKRDRVKKIEKKNNCYFFVLLKFNVFRIKSKRITFDQKRLTE